MTGANAMSNTIPIRLTRNCIFENCYVMTQAEYAEREAWLNFCANAPRYEGKTRIPRCERKQGPR